MMNLSSLGKCQQKSSNFLAPQQMRYKLEINFFQKRQLALELYSLIEAPKGEGKKVVILPCWILPWLIIAGDGTGHSTLTGGGKSLGSKFLSN